MRKLVFACLVFVLCVASLAAQQREEGVAYIENGDNTLYATHKTYPFGTIVVVTNPVTKAQVSVQIGGRPNPVTGALIEISEKAAERLGFPVGYPQWVWVEAATRPAAATTAAAAPEVKHVMRPRVGMFKQTGNAIVLTSGSTLAASHTSLPIGTKLKVMAADRSVVVTVQGRIRASKERIVEISQAAGRALGIQNNTRVTIETISQ
jgi:rare lipoprotein A (peptidoglycan hydrolase)